MTDIFDLDDSAESSFVEEQRAVEPPWLSTLNPEQHDAVITTEGPLLVLSGAGTGKTSVLTARLAYILFRNLAKPWNCMAVTFTNRASQEMSARLASMIGPASDSVWLGTFHRICVRILRSHSEAVGLDSSFTIIDADDQLRLLKQVMDEEGIDVKEWPAKGMQSVIERWKNKALNPEAVPQKQIPEYAGGKALDVYKKYQARLLSMNAVDFGDLLLHCITILMKSPDILAKYQNQFRYILVDEYQDTNVAQYLWLRLLAGKHKNICCVGDDDQSIYSWRGAELGNILRFEKDFDNPKVIRLESNYRSTGNILGAASGLISHNNDRMGKTLRTASKDTEDGDPVSVKGLYDANEEAKTVIEEVENLQRSDYSLSQIAILVRASFQMRELEEKLVSENIPYRVVGGPRFYERMEIRDALAYLRIVAQPSNNLALVRILNKPKRGLGDATVKKIESYAQSHRISMTEAADKMLETEEFSGKAKKSISLFMENLHRWQENLNRISPSDLAADILEESGYIQMWQEDKSPDSPGRVENLKELVNGIEEKFSSMHEFLDHVSLVMENDEKPDGERLSLMTLHAAKGLEFDAVFLPGWEEGLFPHNRALEERGSKALEEERRLAHVGITRARKKVFISYAANRNVFGSWQNSLPSRFVEELPEEYIETDSKSGLYGSNDGFAEESGTWSWSGGGRWKKSSSKASSWKVKKRETSTGIAIGNRVFHDKFGYGTVINADGEKLDIVFEKTGEKKVMASFVEKA